MGSQTGFNPVKQSEQDIANLGLDREFNVPMTEALVYNPLTEQLDRMVQPGSTLPTGASTSAKQDSQITLETQISSLTETLQELVQRLAPLAGAMSNTAQLRAVVTGAVTATGGGYVTSAQVIAALLTQTNTLRYDPNNTLAVLSNINNCVGA